ncbi:methyltransferase domain-containing protein [Leptolyngbya sp. CCNP1308]|uniref:class I SAM-dependent methyltransferase n=1 Tax=Leptolyngbya sp. CCNP1308 TaxID=3110255 RepID=UPI002B20BEDD|nr:methyltransferase domain-containing protein [Leptolyngbya sp. CCNP1308]MEA5448385.1 methyltransferase domain-containing protein [Leptolyngbya sp. CCNP1308]
MSLKDSIEHWVPPGLITAGKFAVGKTPKQKIDQYLRNGRIPWSTGYKFYQQKTVKEALQDQGLLNIFTLNTPLPKNFGLYLDERCVEYPWLFSRLPEKACHILDAGSVLNFEYLLDHSYFAKRRLHIATLAPEYNCFWNKGISYFFEDLRDLPIKDEFYDSIVCLSTLEHVGLDNAQYTQDNHYSENRSSDYLLAVKELRRILKPGGELFISVPFGKYQNFGEFQQFDAALLTDTIAAFGPAQSIEKNYFKYSVDGWQVATEANCADCEYVHNDEWLAQTPGKAKPSDRAAAARAVACVHILR